MALASAGLPVRKGAGQPIIGIANSASDLNPCNLPLRELAVAVKAGIEEAGGIGAEFGTISLGEDLMKPSAMLYRNLLAIEIEELVRANPLDGLVILANCDKSVPGALMGAISANVPTVLVTGGARPVLRFRGQQIGTGTALWRMWDERRAGRLDDDAWAELEQCLSCGLGCVQHHGHRVQHGGALRSARADGARRRVDPGRGGARPGRRARGRPGRGRRGPGRPRARGPLLTADAFANAIVALHAIGGSTNAVIHLAAMAGRAGVPFALDDIRKLGEGVPVLADIEPSGSGLMPDFDRAGGVPTLLREVAGLLHTDARTVTGQTIGDVIAAAAAATGAIRPATAPLREGGAFGVVRGSLAPDGAVIKTSAATPALLRHRGPAVVFRGYDDMLARIDDPALAVTPESGAGPGRLRPGRSPRHAGVGHDPDPGPAGPGRRDRHGPHHRLADERHELRDGRPACRTRGSRRRPARPGPRRRRHQPGRAGRHDRAGSQRRRARPPPRRVDSPAQPAPARLAGPVRTARHAGAGRM